MKLVMTLLVRDEQDILRANIDFHLSQGVDFIIATDNLSIDSSKDILHEYEKKGVLHYIYEQDDDFNQEKWVTRMARMAAEQFNADWVINTDADEFWLPRSGNLNETFSTIPSEYNVIQVERHNFVPMIDNEVLVPFYHSMIYQEVASLNPAGKPLPAKQAHIGNTDVSVKSGNHRVDGFAEQAIIHGLIDIYHFPIRRYSQIENKITKMGAALERNTDQPAKSGGARRALYRDYKQKGNLHHYFDNVTYNDVRITEELKARKIVKNTCIQEYLARLYHE